MPVPASANAAAGITNARTRGLLVPVDATERSRCGARYALHCHESDCNATTDAGNLNSFRADVVGLECESGVESQTGCCPHNSLSVAHVIVCLQFA